MNNTTFDRSNIPENFDQGTVQTKYGPVLITRIISSFYRMGWRRVKYPFSSYPQNKIFRDWLTKSLEINETDADRIFTVASNGKAEIEYDAARWIGQEYGNPENRKKYLPKYQDYIDEE